MKNPWLSMRIALLVASAIASFEFVSMPGDFSQPSWLFFFEMIGIVAAGVVFVLGLQRFNPLSSTEWDSPSWSKNPLLFGEPLQIFHTGAWCLVTTGVAALVLGMFHNPHNWAWELPLGAGLGCLLGVRFTSALWTERRHT
jgi:hypothetical protein